MDVVGDCLRKLPVDDDSRLRKTQQRLVTNNNNTQALGVIVVFEQTLIVSRPRATMSEHSRISVLPDSQFWNAPSRVCNQKHNNLKPGTACVTLASHDDGFGAVGEQRRDRLVQVALLKRSKQKHERRLLVAEDDRRRLLADVFANHLHDALCNESTD